MKDRVFFKINFLIGLIFSINFCFSQTKEELLESIIKSNYVQLDYNNMGADFGILVKKITKEDLFKYANNENSIIRLYAKIALINNGQGNVIQFLKYELKKNKTIEVFEACLGEEITIASVVYSEYFNKKVLDTIQYFENIDSRVNFNKADSLVSQNKVIRKLDSTIIYSEGEVSGLIYAKNFNKKHPKKYLNRIEKLAFEKNNSYAFLYLVENYENKYKAKSIDYLLNKFPNIKFISNNEVMHLINFLSYSLELSDEKLKRISLKILREGKWKDHEYDFIIKELIEQKRIKLE